MAAGASVRADQARQPAREPDAQVSARLQDPAQRRAAAADLQRATANLQRGLARGRSAEPGQVAALQRALNFYAGRPLLEVDDNFGQHTQRVLADVQGILKRDQRAGSGANIGGGKAAAPTINGLVAALNSDQPAANTDAFQRVRAQPNVSNPFGAATAAPSAVIRPTPAEPTEVAGDRRTGPKPEERAITAARAISTSSRSGNYEPADSESATALRAGMESVSANPDARRRALDGVASEVGRHPATRATAATNVITALNAADGAEVYDRIKPRTDGTPDRQRLTPEQHLDMARRVSTRSGDTPRGAGTESLGGMPDNAIAGMHDALRARAATPQRTDADLDGAADLRAEMLRRRGPTADLSSDEGRRAFASDARFAFGTPAGPGTGDAAEVADRAIAARITDPAVQQSLRDTVLKRLEATTPPEGADPRALAIYRLQVTDALRNIPADSVPADMRTRFQGLQDRANPPIPPADMARPLVDSVNRMRAADPQRITRSTSLSTDLDTLRTRSPEGYQAAIAGIAGNVAGNTTNRADQVRDILASVSRDHVGELYPRLNLTPDETRRLGVGLASANEGGVPGARNPELEKLPPAVLQSLNDTLVARTRASGATPADGQAAASTMAALYRARADQPYANDAAGRERLQRDVNFAFGPQLARNWYFQMAQPNEPVHHALGESARRELQTQLINRLTTQVGDRANPLISGALDGAAPPQNATPEITAAYENLRKRAREGAPAVVTPPAERRDPAVEPTIRGPVAVPDGHEPVVPAPAALTPAQLLELANTNPERLTAAQRLELGKTLGARGNGPAGTGQHPFDGMAPTTLGAVYETLRTAGDEGRDPAMMARLAMMRRGIPTTPNGTIADDAAWAFGPAADRNALLGHVANPESRALIDSLFQKANVDQLRERATALAAAGENANPAERALLTRTAATIRERVPAEAGNAVRTALGEVDANLARVPERAATTPRPTGDDPASLARAIRPGNEGVADAQALAQRLEQLRTARGGEQRYRAALTSVAEVLRPQANEQDQAAAERRTRLGQVMLANDNVARDLHTAIGGNDTPARQRDLVELGRAYDTGRPQVDERGQPLRGIPDNVLDSVSDAMLATMPPRGSTTPVDTQTVAAAMRLRWERFQRGRREESASDAAYAFDRPMTVPGSNPTREQPTFRSLAETYLRSVGSDAERAGGQSMTETGERTAQTAMAARLRGFIDRHTPTDRAALSAATPFLPENHPLRADIAAELSAVPTAAQTVERIAAQQRAQTTGTTPSRTVAAREVPRLLGEEGERIVSRAGAVDTARFRALHAANPAVSSALVKQMSPADRTRLRQSLTAAGVDPGTLDPALAEAPRPAARIDRDTVSGNNPFNIRIPAGPDLGMRHLTQPDGNTCKPTTRSMINNAGGHVPPETDAHRIGNNEAVQLNGELLQRVLTQLQTTGIMTGVRSRNAPGGSIRGSVNGHVIAVSGYQFIDASSGRQASEASVRSALQAANGNWDRMLGALDAGGIRLRFNTLDPGIGRDPGAHSYLNVAPNGLISRPAIGDRYVSLGHYTVRYFLLD